MNIQAEKLEIMKLILETDNPGIIESIKEIFEKKTPLDFWETLPQSEKEDILQGIKEIENGDFTDYDTIIKKHR